MEKIRNANVRESDLPSVVGKRAVLRFFAVHRAVGLWVDIACYSASWLYPLYAGTATHACTDVLSDRRTMGAPASHAFLLGGAAVGVDGVKARRYGYRRRTARCSAHEPPPPSTPGRARVRLKRAETYRAKDWPWRGRQRPDFARPWALSSLRRLLAALKDADALAWRVARVVGSLVAALSRSLALHGGPPRDADLIIEYGITDPDPADKCYVHPLSDWEPSPVTYYQDSFGRRVYLTASAPNGFAIALEFRDFEDEENKDSANSSSSTNTNGNKNSKNNNRNTASAQADDATESSREQPDEL